MADLGRLSKSQYHDAPKAPIVLVLDDVRSAYNVGSVFRTADAFRVEKIHLCGITARPPHKDILKTALGATETVEWKYFADIRESVEGLKKEGCLIYAVEQVDSSITLEKFFPPEGKKIALIFGHEVHGVKEAILTGLDGCIEIAQYGTKHSLNIAVSAGIVVWEVFRKMEVAF